MEEYGQPSQKTADGPHREREHTHTTESIYCVQEEKRREKKTVAAYSWTAESLKVERKGSRM